MIEVSSDVGFWILEAYRRMSSQLHFSGTIGNESISLPGIIWWSMPAESRLSIALTDVDREHKRERRLSLRNAQFWFDPVASSGVPSGEIWLSFIKIESEENSLLIGERFVKPS